MANVLRRSTARPTGLRLVLNPLACDGRGVCASLLPEVIRLDDWGYPLLAGGGEVPGHLSTTARSTVRACPKLALRLERAESRVLDD